MYRAASVAVATGPGLYLSSAAGERFLLLEGREPATAVAFNAARKQKAKIREDRRMKRACRRVCPCCTRLVPRPGFCFSRFSSNRMNPARAARRAAETCQPGRLNRRRGGPRFLMPPCTQGSNSNEETIREPA
jgi:hypothetical protein